jgi:hypothetical protein
MHQQSCLNKRSQDGGQISRRNRKVFLRPKCQLEIGLEAQAWQTREPVDKIVVMTKSAMTFSMLMVLALTAYLAAGQPASAISVELAKKCREIAIKAHPPQMAGSKATGIEKAERDSFRECVAKGDKPEK